MNLISELKFFFNRLEFDISFPFLEAEIDNTIVSLVLLFWIILDLSCYYQSMIPAIVFIFYFSFAYFLVKIIRLATSR